MTLLAMALLALAMLVLLSALLLFVEVVAACIPSRATGRLGALRQRLAVLIPAHDEAAGIACTIKCVRNQLVDDDRIVVVADNCTDDTARTAKAAGAEVIERIDPERRGKGYALDFGVRHLALAPPDIVVMLDADCLLSPGALDTLARMCAQHQRPVQALDLMHRSLAHATGMRLAEFAWVLKNQVRPLGLQRLGLPCQLMGTGMAFPWPLLKRIPLANGHLAEDLYLGLEAARIKHAAIFCRDAIVHSRFPASPAGMAQQRTRWEHGHMAAIARAAPHYLRHALASRNGQLLALVLDLCVPPTALLALLAMATVAITAYLSTTVAIRAPFVTATIALSALSLAVGMAWFRFGRDVISLGGLAYAGAYAVRKIPMYVRFWRKRETEWLRSSREGD